MFGQAAALSRHRSADEPLQGGATQSLGTSHTAKGQGYRPWGCPSLQLAPLLTTNLDNQRSNPSLRAGGARRRERGEERGSLGGLRGVSVFG